MIDIPELFDYVRQQLRDGQDLSLTNEEARIAYGMQEPAVLTGERASVTELQLLLRSAEADCARGASLSSHMVAAWLVRAMCSEILAARDGK